MKICIAGKNQLAVNAITFLLSKKITDIKNILVCPNDTDSGKDDWQPSLKFYALKNDLEIVQINQLYKIEDLFFISLEFNKIIIPGNFFSEKLYNIHFSLLPKYKGMYTSLFPILNGETVTGVTLHSIDDGIDTGDIIDQIKFRIDVNDTSRDLYFNYMQNAELLFKNNIKNLIAGNYFAKPQSNIEASYYSKNATNFKNFNIELNKTSFEIHNQIRAYIFKEYQLPLINSKKIIKSTLTTEFIGRNKNLNNNHFIYLSGIDGFKIILETDD